MSPWCLLGLWISSVVFDSVMWHGSLGARLCAPWKQQPRGALGTCAACRRFPFTWQIVSGRNRQRRSRKELQESSSGTQRFGDGPWHCQHMDFGDRPSASGFVKHSLPHAGVEAGLSPHTRVVWVWFSLFPPSGRNPHSTPAIFHCQEESWLP